MKISCIIPVYKVEEYLHQCVDSVLMQTMDDFEIILVDDGSPDNCPQICDEYATKFPDKIRVIHKQNGGPADARNAGLKQAQGDYIFFIDSDDYLVGDRLAELYSKAVEYNADILNTSYVTLNERSKELLEIPLRFESEKLLTHSDMEKEICFASSKNRITFAWRNLYKKEFLDKNSITFAAELRMIEDGPFNMQAFTLADRFVAVDIPIYCYRLRADSLQRKKYITDYDEWLYKQWKLKLKYYEDNCTPSPLFYEDIAEYTIKYILPTLLRNVYINHVEDRYQILKRIANSDMMKKSFADYDINKFKSKSLDWLMTKFIKNKKYYAAHLICEKVLYK